MKIKLTGNIELHTKRTMNEVHVKTKNTKHTLRLIYMVVVDGNKPLAMGVEGRMNGLLNAK